MLDITKIPQLPPWNLTNPLPAFHDYESLSAIDQTARLYGTMRGLIDDYNEFRNKVNIKLIEYCNDLNADQEQFKNEINTLVHDYIIALDAKIAHQDREIEESIIYIKENLLETINIFYKQMKEEGEFNETVLETFDNLKNKLESMSNEIANQTTKIASIVASSPEIVDSTSNMSDTGKVYILSTNMHIYVYSSNAWTDTGIIYGENINSVSGYGLPLNTETMWNQFNNDCNDLTPNKIYLINYNQNVVNLPEDNFNGTIIYLTDKIGRIEGSIQIGIRAPGTKMFFRQNWKKNESYVWSDWKQVSSIDDLPTSIVKGYEINLNNETKWNVFESDCNKLTPNKIYLITYVTGIENLPNGFSGGTIFTYNYLDSTFSGNVQLAIRGNGKNIWYRINWGGSESNWTQWVELAHKTDIKSKIPNLFESFLRVGCIGDSLASGECAYKDENNTIKYVDLYDYSWGQFMARATGNTYYNFSKGGLTTKTWLTNEKGLPLATDGNHPCEAYIIGLGVNDTLQNMSVGTIEDINDNDHSQNADTYFGNYGKIIQSLKVLYPKAKFFLLTNPSTSLTEYNQAVRDIATHFDNCYCIDLKEISSLYSAGTMIYECRRSGHYNAIAYKEMSEILLEQLNKYMYENYEEFKQIEFINTNYEWID